MIPFIICSNRINCRGILLYLWRIFGVEKVIISHKLESVWCIISYRHKFLWNVGTSSYSGNPGFRSLPGDGVSLLRVLMIFPVLPGRY
jgi:hypothetical protein